ncbi:MAG: sugar phosphate nucleotidyltransferase [Gemmatimonadales bacterium]
MSRPATSAIVLARGLGTRMRREAVGVEIDPAQAAAADRGLKMMIPDARGRPFLVHLLSSLADAGVTEVCLVVAPDHNILLDYFAQHPAHRLRIHFAVQAEPLGTANAVLAAESWRAGRDALVLNADNLYPIEAIEALVTLDGPGLVAFDFSALVREGNVEAGRIASFAILEIRPDGTLARIVEKPDPATLAAAGPAPWVSMNLWRLDSATVAACRDVPKSARGEYELPEAIALAITRGAVLQTVRVHAGVLDLSARGDIASVAARLATLEPSA